MSTDAEGAEGRPTPALFVALTTNVCLVPFSSPVITQEVAGLIAVSTEQVLSGSDAGHAV
ncbi:unannotated protein [freshwater metagenome]|uniref:Unannotated protein n=1 Tax=freshwater metagenome TaxID=449393 RepID=A0A6J5YG10_9ZZZZ